MNRTIKAQLEVPESWFESVTAALQQVDDKFAADLGRGTAGSFDRLVTFIIRDALRDEKSRTSTIDAYTKALDKMAQVQREFGIVIVGPTEPAKGGKKGDAPGAKKALDAKDTGTH